MTVQREEIEEIEEIRSGIKALRWLETNIRAIERISAAVQSDPIKFGAIANEQATTTAARYLEQQVAGWSQE